MRLDEEELQRVVVAAVDAGADEQIVLLQRLVSFASENANLLSDEDARAAGKTQEQACQDVVAETLASMGASIDRWEHAEGRVDVVGRFGGADAGANARGARSLMLNGHVDVVPAGAAQDWPYAPWSGAVVDGRLWGRGSSDMKGGLVAGIGALAALSRAGLSPLGEIVFESVTDEEVGGPGTRSAIERSYRADAVIVLEPTSNMLCPVEGGLEWLDVTVTGVAGHSAQRYKSVHAGGQGRAVNAIEKAAKVLAAVQEYERHRGNTAVHPLMPLGITTINPGMIAGGSGGELDGRPRTTLAYSNMSDFCVLGLSLKYLPSEDRDEVRAAFEAYIAAVAATDPWLRDHPPSIEWGRHGVSMPPAETQQDHPFLQTIERASLEVTGAAVWTGFEAKTDMCWLVDAGMPGLIYGPGAIDQAHGASEYIDLGELRTATSVLALTIARWCGVQ